MWSCLPRRDIYRREKQGSESVKISSYLIGWSVCKIGIMKGKEY